MERPVWQNLILKPAIVGSLPLLWLISCGQASQSNRTAGPETAVGEESADSIAGHVAKLIRPGVPTITYRLSATAAGAQPFSHDFVNLQNAPALTPATTWQAMCDRDVAPASVKTTDASYMTYCASKKNAFNDARSGAASWRVERIDSNDAICADLTVKKVEFGDLVPEDMLFKIGLRKPVTQKNGTVSYDAVAGEADFYAPMKADAYPAKISFCISTETAKKYDNQKMVLNVHPVTKSGASVAYSYMPLVGIAPNLTGSKGPFPSVNFNYVIGTQRPQFSIDSVGSGLVPDDKHGTKLVFAKNGKASDIMALNNEGELPSFNLAYSLNGKAQGPEVKVGNKDVRTWSQSANAVHNCQFKANFLTQDGNSISGARVVGSVSLVNDDSCSVGAPNSRAFAVPAIDLGDLRTNGTQVSDSVEIVMTCVSPRVNHLNKTIAPLVREARALIKISNFSDLGSGNK